METGAIVYKHEDTIIFTLSIGVLAAAFLVQKHFRTPYDPIFESVGKEYNIDHDLLRAIAQKESSMRADVIGKEPKNHQSFGLMQIYDDTARHLGITDYMSLLKPELNIKTAARLLNQIKGELGQKFSTDAWIAAYNAGAPNILSRGIFNAAYVADVKQHYYLFKLGGQIVG